VIRYAAVFWFWTLSSTCIGLFPNLVTNPKKRQKTQQEEEMIRIWSGWKWLDLIGSDYWIQSSAPPFLESYQKYC
jgi:hypothetical protein